MFLIKYKSKFFNGKQIYNYKISFIKIRNNKRKPQKRKKTQKITFKEKKFKKKQKIKAPKTLFGNFSMC